MKRPRPKTQRWYGYYDGRPVNQMDAVTRTDAFNDLWKMHRRENPGAIKTRFTVDNEAARQIA